MERSIITEFQRLQVLPRFDFQNMDELVQDLTNALEESSSTRNTSKTKKRRGFKRRSKKLPSTVTLAARLSEDSESSFDDVVTLKESADSIQFTDSDEINSTNYLSVLSYFRRHTPFITGSFVESDSVNENFSPIEPHRRKRKFKRMAVDPSPRALGSSDHFECLINPKNECCKILKHRSDIENMCRNLRMDPFGLMMCGKRKRSIREKSVENTNNEESSSVLFSPSVVSSAKREGHNFLEPLQRREEIDCRMDCCDDRQLAIKQLGDSSSSSLSSSESDAGVYTNDEGREGDDEQSDFYHESGPTCGIPGVIPWWESEAIEESLSEEIDPKFHAILSGSFQQMSWQSQQNFREHVRKYELNGREIRSGRRRLRDLRPSFSFITSFNDKISKFLQDPEQTELRLPFLRKKERDQLSYLASVYSLNVRIEGKEKNKYLILMKTRNTTQVVNVDRCNFPSMPNRTLFNEIKRRRKAPPCTPGIKAIVGENSSPIDSDNVGSKMMRSMGWKPGTGLGVDSKGIQNPVQAVIRPKLQGLGFGDET